MGVVYKARHPKINMLVALKTITTNVADNPDLLQRFYREGQSLGVLQHPNIATIYDMGEDEGLPFIAMEYVDGQSLGEVIARRSPIPLYLKLEYAIQACRAFDYAHKRGIIHRDIKPGNVMLSKLGVVKVVDFGIARVLESSQTKSGIIMGTFAYMSPEVFHGEHADGRSDIFSFGVLLFELICYSKPFPGETPANLMQSICLQEPKRLRELMPDCPPELDSVIERMLLKPVTERFQSMEDLLLDLEPICKSLQAETVAELIAQSRQLIQQEEFSQARDLLRQALQVDFSNAQARSLVAKVDIALKKKLLRPKAQQHVENGTEFLQEGKLDEAKALADSALELDSTFEPAQELLRKIEQQVSRAKLLNEKLQAAKQRLAEGLLDEVEALLAPILEQEPANSQALVLREQVLDERSRRQKLHRLLENMQQARVLWTHQKYDECINLLTVLQEEFPEEEDIRKLMETAREDRAEQYKQQTLEEVRNLLAARRYGTCEELLSGLREQFPNDGEIPRVLDAVREDQARQRKADGLAEARNLLASTRFEESITLLAELGKDFVNDDEIAKLVKTIREEQEKQRRQQGIAEVRNLLAARRYEDCNALLAGLQKQFPGDNAILELVEAVRDDQTQQLKLKSLAEARTLRGSKRYEESLSVLSAMESDFKGDEDISKLRELVLDEWAEQRMLKGLADARELLSSKRYEDSIALLSTLQKEFPLAEDIPELRELVLEEWAEQRILKGLADARELLSSKRYEESIALLSTLQKEFPVAKDIPKLREHVQEEWAEQRLLKGLADARELLSSKRYEESIALLSALRKEHPSAEKISKLLASAEQERAEHERQQKVVEARTLLAAQRWEEALALLDSLLASQPKDSTVLKLRALAQNEREKQAKSEHLRQEWEALKELTGKEAYPEVVARVEQLLRDFPGDGNLLRLLGFAREQLAQRDRALRLRKALDEVESHLKSNRLAEAIASANLGLESFPQNTDLNRLLEQAATRQKRERTRQAIEQRVRDIKIKINREEFSDAIQMAEDAINTLGPDTDVTQLLSSAQVEYNAREKKKEQDRKLESVRTFLDSGNLEAATLLFDETIKSENLDPEDPRVHRLSEEIAAAMTVTESKTDPIVAAPPQPSPIQEYALWEGPPLPAPSPLPEGASQQALAASASASQVPGFSQPVAPQPPPQIVRVPITPAVPDTKPPQPVEPESAPKVIGSPVGTPTRPPKGKKRATQTKPAMTGRDVSVREAGAAPARPSADIPLGPVPIWRGPAILGAALLAIILLALPVVRLLVPKQPRVAPTPAVVPSAGVGAPAPSQPVQPVVNATKPPVPAAGTSDAALTALLRQEELLWNRAKQETDAAQFPQAQGDLRKILALGAGGVRKDDARKYLDQVIPQREQEERLFGQAQQAIQRKDPSSLQRATDLFGQVAKMGGPRQQESQKLLSEAQKSLALLTTSIASLTESARADLNRNDFRSARDVAKQMQQTGGDPSSLNAEINQAEQTFFAQLENSLNQLKQRRDEGALQPLANLEKQFQTLAESGGPTANDARRDVSNVTAAIRDLTASMAAAASAASAEAAFQKASAQYQRVKDNKDPAVLEASRSELQSIVRGGGARASDAQRLLDEVNLRINALNAPPVTPVTPPPVAPDETPAIRAAVQQYATAFQQRDADALRKIWPSLGGAEYERFKQSFSMAGAIRMSLSNENIVVAADHATATVTADVNQDYTPKGGRPMKSADHTVFYLVKQGNAWVIKDRK
jgi:eukaryotic-like serine/threonine-protein kinase